MRRDVEVLCSLPHWRARLPSKLPPEADAAIAYLLAGPEGKPPFTPKRSVEWCVLFAWIACRRLGEVISHENPAEISRSWIDEWQLARVITQALRELKLEEGAASRATSLVRLLTGHQAWWSVEGSTEASELIGQAHQLLHAWLQDGELQRFLVFNRYQGVLWFNKESFDEWLWWAYTAEVIHRFSEMGDSSEDQFLRVLQNLHAVVLRLQAAADYSGYQVEKLLEGVQVG
jgi:hypothetical protein